MIPRTAPIKSKHPCNICTKRKIKCDRLIPCHNCTIRGHENLCTELNKSKKHKLQNNNYNESLFKIWQEYEHWILKNCLIKSDLLNTKSITNFHQDLEEVNFCMKYITMEASFKLLDYSMENLGGLYFGCIGDIGELYLKLEEYWTMNNADTSLKTIDEFLWNGIIWAVLTMTVYYISIDELSNILDEFPASTYFESGIKGKWSEELQFQVYKSFLKTSLHQLYMANFMCHPDVRIIQTFLILSTTPFSQIKLYLANSLLVHSLHIAKFLQIDKFKPLVSDSTTLSLTKLTSQKLWYKLCIYDYLQSGPNKVLSLHQENNSLLNHAAYLEDLPNVDIYQSEDTLETLNWKIVSLDRDLEQYNLKKPSLKTLDSVERQLEIFTIKINALEESNSGNSQFEQFLLRFYLNSAFWKLKKLSYIYYNSSNGFENIATYTKILIALILKNIKNKFPTFNKFPYVLYVLMLLVGFHSFYYIFYESSFNEQLLIDLKEVLIILSEMLKPMSTKVNLLIRRMGLLKTLWNNVKVIDNEEMLNHPIIKILQNDIIIASQQFHRIPTVIYNYGPILPRDIPITSESESKEFREIVENFEQNYGIIDLIYQK